MAVNTLFIGGAGFIGSSIIKKMMQEKVEVGDVFVLEPSYANLSRLEDIPVKVITGDISNIDLIETLIKTNDIKKIVHLVSNMVPGSGYEEYKSEFESVIFPTVRLLQLCSEHNIQFIFFSSGGTVYGERKNMKPFVETDPKEPISYYGLSKQVIENSIIFEHRTSNLQYLILRPSNPYGPGQNINGHQGLIAVAMGKILSRKPVTIWGDGTSVRDYIYIDDLSNAFCQLFNKGVTNKIVNIGSGKGYSIKQIMDILSSVVDENVVIEFSKSRKNDVTNMILDTTLLKSLIDMDLMSIEHGIKQFYEYEKEVNKNG